MPSIPPEAREPLAAYLRFQQALGVETVRIRLPLETPAARSDAAPAAAAAAAATSEGAGPAAALAAIQADIGPDCRRCTLCQARHSIVFGEGNAQADLVFVGEGPGADEDAQGRPFVGRAGQLLTDMIEKGMGLRRADVYICNVVKCRPPGNRTPEPDEIAACGPFLRRQLLAIRPRVVCALGATAAGVLRPYQGALGPQRGRLHPLQVEDFSTQLVVTYHPAYLLRDPSQKREAWKDLQLIMAFLGLPGSAR
ncbi:MAG: uracil-DNA glycosylase [Terriglobales bacterium]